MTVDEQATNKVLRQSWLRRHWFFTFVVSPFLVASLLQVINEWHATNGAPVPQQFTILIYNKTAHRIIAREYNDLGTVTRRLKSEGDQYTYLLPPHPARYYPYADKDSFVSVKRVSNRKQVIIFHYEIALLSHGWSKYQATDKIIKPVSEEAGGDVYFFLAFAVAILAAILLFLVDMIAKLARSFVSRVRKR